MDPILEAAAALLAETCGDVLPDGTIRVSANALDALRQEIERAHVNL